MNQSQRKIIILLADTHGGHKLGLLTPGTGLFDEDEDGNLTRYTPRLTATQKYIWRCYEDDLHDAETIADGAPITIIHNGDLTHGKKYPHQLVSTRDADQVLIAIANLECALNLPNVANCRIIHGTAAHTFGEGTAPLLVAEVLRAKFSKVSVATLSHGLFSVGADSLDVAHHGAGPGGRKWLEGNILRYYVRDIMLRALVDGDKPPTAVVRAHFHTYTRETVRVGSKRGTFTTEAFILPAYCGLSEHGRQATRSTSTISTGMLVVEIEGGKVKEYHPRVHYRDVRTKEEL